MPDSGDRPAAAPRPQPCLRPRRRVTFPPPSSLRPPHSPLPTPRFVPDPLLRFRDEFPILARTTYLVSNSLGAMPRATRERLLAYADAWDELGVRAWA